MTIQSNSVVSSRKNIVYGPSTDKYGSKYTILEGDDKHRPERDVSMHSCGQTLRPAAQPLGINTHENYTHRDVAHYTHTPTQR